MATRVTGAGFTARSAALASVLVLGACFGSDDASDGGSSGSAGSGGGSSGAAGSGAVGGAGSGGTGGDGLDGGGPSCAPCLDTTLRWGSNGGLVAFSDSSGMDACNRYAHAREPMGDPLQPFAECVREVPCMGSGLHGVSDVLNALADPDVVDALAVHMVLFGEDSRAFDGTVFRIEVGSDMIDVGSPCESAGCTPIPTGVSALADLLVAIDGEQLALEPCAGKFD